KMRSTTSLNCSSVKIRGWGMSILPVPVSQGPTRATPGVRPVWLFRDKCPGGEVGLGVKAPREGLDRQPPTPTGPGTNLPASRGRPVAAPGVDRVGCSRSALTIASNRRAAYNRAAFPGWGLRAQRTGSAAARLACPRLPVVRPGEGAPPMTSTGSVTHWIGQLKAGDPAAAQKLWEGYFRKMVELARQKLQGLPRRAADEEDVALSAFHSFCRGARGGRFPQVGDRNSLWPLLVAITAHKAIDLLRYEHRRKRGGPPP